MSDFNKLRPPSNKGIFVNKPKNSAKKKPGSVSRCVPNEFHMLWKDMEAKIKDIESSFYQDTFASILRFVQTSFQFNSNAIPAAVLQMGVNMSDHSGIFQKLNQLLKDNGNHTVILDPKKCHNISRMFYIIDQELGAQLDINDFNKQQNSKPIVFLIQDIETFNGEFLEEIILNSKVYAKKLPLILILGMSSTMVTLHTVLPQKVLCYLGIETFQSFTAADYLTHIIEEVVLSPLQPFKLGPKVLRLIVDTVLYHDFSVTNLMLLLQFCLFEHFYINKAATLCCSAAELEKKINALNNDELQFFKGLPSLKLYLENNPEIFSSISNNTALRSLLRNLLENQLNYQNYLLISLRVLHCLTKDLPSSPLGKQFREVYLLHLAKQLCSTKGFSEAEKYLKFQSQKEMLAKFKTCLNILKDQECCTDLLKLIKESIGMISALDESDFKPQQQKTPYGQEHFNSRFELQQKMRSSILLKRSKFEEVRSKIVDGLISYFKNLNSPLLMPLHEILFFDNLPALKTNLMPSLRVLFCSALSNPHLYFQCQCCNISQSAISSSLPDACILYKLHLECGKLINLCDWMEDFKRLEGSWCKAKMVKGAPQTEPDKSIIIRFLHAASELQLLGFTRLTKRKTDHVIRLVF